MNSQCEVHCWNRHITEPVISHIWQLLVLSLCFELKPVTVTSILEQLYPSRLQVWEKLYLNRYVYIISAICEGSVIRKPNPIRRLWMLERLDFCVYLTLKVEFYSVFCMSHECKASTYNTSTLLLQLLTPRYNLLLIIFVFDYTRLRLERWCLKGNRKSFGGILQMESVQLLEIFFHLAKGVVRQSFSPHDILCQETDSKIN